jgi:hypothetical protein
MTSLDQSHSRHWISTASCIAFVLLCILIAHPFAEIGFGDDSSYIYTAKRAAETGRLIYNGWATASLGYLVYLGALFTKLFGFSFTNTRAAVMLICLANVAVLHRLFLRIAANNFNAVATACAVAVGPMAFSYSLLFYTDVPGMFAITVALYGVVRAVQSTTAPQTVRWIIWTTVANLMLGTVRQIALMGALLLVPTVGWALRRRPGVLVTTAACWVASVAFVLAIVHWFAQQPYAAQEALILHYNLLWFERSFAIPAALLVESLPVLLAFLFVHKLRRQPMILVKSMAIATVLCIAARLMPYQFLDFVYAADTNGSFLQQPAFAFVLLWVCLVCACIAISMAIQTCRAPRAALDGEITFWSLFCLSLPCTLACVLLITTRESAWTRYILPVVPIWAALLYRLYADVTNNARLPMLTLGVTGLYAVASVCVAHDDFAESRAAKAAEQWYVAKGYPRQQLEASIGLDSWFEISNGHTFNEPRVRIPANAYHRRFISPELAACVSPYLSYMLEIHPADVLTQARPNAQCYEPMPLHDEVARMWSRPDRTVHVYRLLPPLRDQ